MRALYLRNIYSQRKNSENETAAIHLAIKLISFSLLFSALYARFDFAASAPAQARSLYSHIEPYCFRIPPMKISGRFIVLLFLAAAALPVTADVFGGSSWLRATGEDWAPRQTKVRALAEAAENGDTRAMRQLGLMSMKGQKVKKSARIAVQWWEKAADAGDAMSMMYLGDASARGLGCSKNASKAMKWYADAFSAMQEEDERLDCNPELPLVKRIRKLPLSVTLKWWKERCEAGDAHAMYYLGTLGKKKRDGELSEEDAASYLAQAAAAGHAKARKKLERQDARQAKSAEEEDCDSQSDEETEDVPEADNEQDEDTPVPEDGGKAAEISDSQRDAETTDAPEVDDGLNEAGVETEPGSGEKDTPADGDVSPEDKAEQADKKSNEQIIAEIKGMSSEDQFSHMERWMERNDLSSFKQSLDAGVSVDLSYDGLKRMCMEAADSWLNAQIVEELIKSNDLTSELTSNNGNPFSYDVTLLHAAAMNEKIEFVKELISRGAKVNEQTNFGETPLYLAALTGNRELVQMLLAAGAEDSLHTRIYSEQKERARAVLLHDVQNLDRFLNDRTSVVSPTGAYQTVAMMARSGAFPSDVSLYILEYLERSKREGDTYDVEMNNQLLRELNPPSYWLPVFITIAILAATGFGVFYYIRKKKARSEESADKNDEAIHPSPAEPFPPLPASMQQGADLKQYYICQPGGPATGPFPGAMVREAVHHRLYTPDTLAKSDENSEWVSVYQLFQ